MKRAKRGFTIMEIIVSVIIISIVVLGILKINRENVYMAEYVSFRIKGELSNSLFLTDEAFHYNGSEKDAYTLLQKMGISNLKTKEYLKNLKRKIYVDEFDMERPSVPVMLKAIRLHSKFSTQYYRFNSR